MNTHCLHIFLEGLSKVYPQDDIPRSMNKAASIFLEPFWERIKAIHFEILTTLTKAVPPFLNTLKQRTVCSTYYSVYLMMRFERKSDRRTLKNSFILLASNVPIPRFEAHRNMLGEYKALDLK